MFHKRLKKWFSWNLMLKYTEINVKLVFHQIELLQLHLFV